MMIQITQSGMAQRLTVEQVEFVVKCKYTHCVRNGDGIGPGWFLTIDPDRLFCGDTHKVRHCQRKRVFHDALHNPGVMGPSIH